MLFLKVLIQNKAVNFFGQKKTRDVCGHLQAGGYMKVLY